MTATLHDSLAAYLDEVDVGDEFFVLLTRRALRLRRRRHLLVSSAALSILLGAGTATTLALQPGHGSRSSSVQSPGTRAAGGSVTLTLLPVGTEPASMLGDAQVNSEKQVLLRRLTAAGLGGSTVSGTGKLLTLTAPGGTTQTALIALTRPGTLAIRAVATGCSSTDSSDPKGSCAIPYGGAQHDGNGPLPFGFGPITMTRTQAEGAFNTLDCANAAERQRLAHFTPTSWALGCGPGTLPEKYLLEPAGVKQGSIKAVHLAPQLANVGPSQVTTPYYQVSLSFTDGSYTTLTRSTAGGDRLTAIVVDGTVETANANASAIMGDAKITGSFTEAAARQLAALLTAGPLPYQLGLLNFTHNP